MAAKSFADFYINLMYVHGELFLHSKMSQYTKNVQIKFQFLTPSLREIISLTDFLKHLDSAAVVVTRLSHDFIPT